MGIYGTGIFSNDVSNDVKEIYTNKLKSGKSDEEALAETISDCTDFCNDADDKHDFRYALSDTMWKYGRMTDHVKNKAISLIDSGGDCYKWLSEGESIEAQKRKEVLSKLKERLESDQPGRKHIAGKRKFIFPWQIGDVLLYEPSPEFKQKLDVNAVLLQFTRMHHFKDSDESQPMFRIALYKGKGMISEDILRESRFLRAGIFQKNEFDKTTTSNCIQAYVYEFLFLTGSKRSIPFSAIKPIGNYPVYNIPDEYIDYNSFSALYWNEIESKIQYTTDECNNIGQINHLQN